MAQKLSDLFERRWVCMVVHTGYSVSSGCDPSDPHHADWKCDYGWVAPVLTDAGAERYGLTYHSECETAWHVHTATNPDGTSKFCQIPEVPDDPVHA